MNNVLKRFLQTATTCCVFTVLFTLAATPVLAETKFSIRGDLDVSLNYGEDTTLNRTERDDDPFTARQRLRIWLTAEPSDTLKVIGMVRIASGEWGRRKFADGRDSGFQLDGDGANFRTRFLFVDWQEADSPLRARAGLIPVNVPHASFFTGIMDTSSGGVDLTYKLNENVSLVGVWARPYDEQRSAGSAGLDDEMDIFMLKAPMKFGDISITPWAMYSMIGGESSYWNSGYAAKASTNSIAGTGKTIMSEDGDSWWGGVAATVPFTSDLTLKLDAAVASLETNKKDENYNTKGWQTSARLDYKMDWAVPGLFGWYASGSDADKIRDKNEYGVVPVISAFDAGFNATSFGFGVPGGLNLGSFASTHMAGRWGVGAQLADMSFFENFKHTLRVAYYQGTNDNDVVNLTGYKLANLGVGGLDYIVMTKKDKAFEVNFDHTWAFHEKAVVYANMGYMHLDRQTGWKNVKGDRIGGKVDAWQVAANLRVNF